MIRTTADPRLRSTCLELLRTEDESAVEGLVRDGIRCCWKELFVRAAVEEAPAGLEQATSEPGYDEQDEHGLSAGVAFAGGREAPRESEPSLRPHDVWEELDDDFW